MEVPTTADDVFEPVEQFGNGSDMKLRQLISSFENWLRLRVKLGQNTPSTVDFYLNQLKKLKSLGGRPAASIRPHDLAELVMTNHLVRSIKRLFSWAVDEELIPKNHFTRMKTPPTGQRTRTLNSAEFTKLLSACTEPFRTMLELACETAARPIELRELRWREVRIEERVIALTKFKAKDRRRDGLSVRQIPLTGRAVELLDQLRAARPGADAGEHVFVGRGGKPLGANAVRCRMRVARQKAGLNDGGEAVVCYTLRHTRATDLTRKGVDSNTLSKIMGHTSPLMTRRYQHLTGSDLCNVLDKADGQSVK